MPLNNVSQVFMAKQKQSRTSVSQAPPFEISLQLVMLRQCQRRSNVAAWSWLVAPMIHPSTLQRLTDMLFYGVKGTNFIL